MCIDDKEKTMNCYVHIVLECQISCNVEAYIDDIVVKSKSRGDLITDLKETFNNLCRNKMMLNPDKCTFGVSSGNLATAIHLPFLLPTQQPKLQQMVSYVIIVY